MKSNRITLVTLAAEDVPALTAFYSSLGWVIEESLEGTCFFDMDGAKFGIYDKALLARDLGRDPDSLGTGAMTLAQNFPDRAAVDAAYDRAIAAGGTVCKPPEAVFWGGYSGTWADPEGHVWEYAHNPFWELTEDGRLA
ncbi:VOC family protein [Marinibacterium profundimaris]|uniref:Glyoxalase n=1 Tax=Marinibacterium profundimaris TaxID=1679460 RepID=A0A225NM97_9RHOB|nr:VOC family protein [Marinibacterium profundimaris]OWU75641.1 glyoxalase [Marinibacterium profundimaris]